MGRTGELVAPPMVPPTDRVVVVTFRSLVLHPSRSWNLLAARQQAAHTRHPHQRRTAPPTVAPGSPAIHPRPVGERRARRFFWIWVFHGSGPKSSRVSGVTETIVRSRSVNRASNRLEIKACRPKINEPNGEKDRRDNSGESRLRRTNGKKRRVAAKGCGSFGVHEDDWHLNDSNV